MAPGGLASLNIVDTASGSRALIVLGMHRSGTSATAGALRCVGVPLGRHLYRGHQGVNPRGYFEHRDLADTNQDALLAIGSDWDDVLRRERDWWRDDRLRRYADQLRAAIKKDFSQTELWAVKDPRVCRLLPWWLAVLEAEQVSPVFVIVVRRPEAVCQSLARRDGFDREKSLLLWLLHYLDAEQGSRSYPRAFIEYEAFLRSPLTTLAGLEQALEIAFPVPPTAASRCLQQFVSTDLDHFDAARAAGDATPMAMLAGELHGLLLDKSRDGDAAVSPAAIDALRQRLDALYEAFPAALISHIGGIAERRAEAGLFVRRVMRSWSWYLGKPVRFVERLVGRDV